MEVRESDHTELPTSELPTLENTELPSPENAESPDTEVPELHISKAVVEVLQALFSSQPPDSLDISVKSTRKLSGLTSGSWFYIKVSTSSQIVFEHFKDCSVLPWLLELLEKMQRLEAESHLCIQTSVDGVALQQNGVGGVKLQQNLVLQGTSLVVEQETRKQKPVTGSSLYLRVHQSHSHMMAEAQRIYKVLQVVKIFTPRMAVQFNMKMGDVVCRSHYRTSEWISLCPELPDIVSVSRFYLHKSSYTADSDYVKASVTGPDTLSIRVGGATERLEVTCVGVYIPIVSETGRSSIITLTMLGPGWFPLDISELGEPALLCNLNLSRLGLRAVSAVTDNSNDTSPGMPSCHWKLSVQSTNKHVPIESFMAQLFLDVVAPAGNQTSQKEFTYVQNHLFVIVEQLTDRLCGMVRDTLHKSLQAWIETAKTRTLLYRSMRSASKAVRDIVTLSNNDDFRQEIFGLMRVDSTLDLEKKVQSKLTSISKRKHYGVWSVACLDSQQAEEGESSQSDKQIHSIEPNNECYGAATAGVGNNKPHSNDADQPSKHTDKAATTIGEMNNRLRPNNMDNLLIKTPEVNLTQKNVEDISPFQQLAEDLMDAVDNICETESGGHGQTSVDSHIEFGGGSDEMHEEPFVRTQTDDEIMAQLFYDNDKDTNDCGENKLENRSALNQNKKIKDIHMKGSHNEMVPRNGQVLAETKVCRPELLTIQRESRPKRSFSFPKDLGHSKEGSAKFYRALSGDKLVPHSMSVHQDHNELNDVSNKNLLPNQYHSFQPVIMKGKNNRSIFDSLHQDSSIFKAEIVAHNKNYKPNVETAKKSGVETYQSFSQINKIGQEKASSFDREELDNEFQDTFDVISQFVDDCVDKEMVDIGGHLNMFHIQSQVVGNEFDQNNNSVKEKDCVTKKSGDVKECKAGDKDIDKPLTDSDDWFDAAVADIENWFN